MTDYERGRLDMAREAAELLELDADFCRDLADEYPLHASRHGWRVQMATIRRAVVLLGHLAGGTRETAELWLRQEQAGAELEQARSVLELPPTAPIETRSQWLSTGSDLPH